MTDNQQEKVKFSRLAVGDVRQAGDQYHCSEGWLPIPEDTIGRPIPEGSFIHRRPITPTS